ncbi:MAG: hypothetical protein CL596_11105 [Alteromonas sp.]|nr:hypothetical protein [Alteromonas sp.]MAY22006.1 hypothetical protein [Flavobacteriaceae bacterium]|tara:strand:- start:24259 stop:24603 length:345 start_codon:yes stop_codon:yes gene_type:complete
MLQLANPVIPISETYDEVPATKPSHFPIQFGKAIKIWNKLLSDLKHRGIYQDHIENLTDQECAIIQLIAEGLQSKEIAQQLCISKHTVQTHRKNIYRKLETDSIADIIKISFLL